MGKHLYTSEEVPELLKSIHDKYKESHQPKLTRAEMEVTQDLILRSADLWLTDTHLPSTNKPTPFRSLYARHLREPTIEKLTNANFSKEERKQTVKLLQKDLKLSRDEVIQLLADNMNMTFDSFKNSMYRK